MGTERTNIRFAEQIAPQERDYSTYIEFVDESIPGLLINEPVQFLTVVSQGVVKVESIDIYVLEGELAVSKHSSTIGTVFLKLSYRIVRRILLIAIYSFVLRTSRYHTRCN